MENLSATFFNTYRQIEQSNYELNVLKEKLIQTMSDIGIKSYTVENITAEQDKKTIILAEKMTIKFNNEKLKKVLGKKLYKKVTNTTITISDFESFKQIMKQYDVPFDEVKDCLDIREEVSNAKINELYKIGEIDLNEIKPCYTASFMNYITVR